VSSVIFWIELIVHQRRRRRKEEEEEEKVGMALRGLGFLGVLGF
jgi:hypothetical protein